MKFVALHSSCCNVCTHNTLSHLDISNDISLKNPNAMKWGLSNLLQFVISNHADLDLVMPRNYIQKGKNEPCK